MEYSEQPKSVEHAYSVSQRREARRKLITQRVRTAIAATAIVGSFLGVGKVMQQASEKDYNPDSYYSGKVEVVMSDNLNVRESPIVITNKHEQSNAINWNRVKEVNGVRVEGNNSFIIDNPLITEGDDPMSEGGEKGSWITFDAKVDNGLGLTDEKLYVSLSAATNEYVKPVESGSFVKLDSLLAPSQDLGKVSVNP